MQQDFTNTFKNLSHTPYRLMAAGNGTNNIKFPDGTVKGCEDVKRELGYPQLLAWNVEGKKVREWVQYLNDNPQCECDLVIDSGAYSAWSVGKAFCMDEYLDFINNDGIIEKALWVAEADVIPGSFGVDPTAEEIEEAPEKSWENYLYMIDRVKYPKKVVPIYHMGEDTRHLKRMLDYKLKDGEFIPYIGISPRNDVNVNEKIKWYESTWAFIYEECAKIGREIPLTHNFGMTTISMMEQFPSFSSDSTSWLRSAAFGNCMIVINGKIKTVVASSRQLINPDHLKYQPKAVKDEFDRICAMIGHGVTVQSLIDDIDDGLRMIFNLYSLNEWRKNFKYVGTQEFKESLW